MGLFVVETLFHVVMFKLFMVDDVISGEFVVIVVGTYPHGIFGDAFELAWDVSCTIVQGNVVTHHTW